MFRFILLLRSVRGYLRIILQLNSVFLFAHVVRFFLLTHPVEVIDDKKQFESAPKHLSSCKGYSDLHSSQ